MNISADVYLFPCAMRAAGPQVTGMLNGLGKAKFGCVRHSGTPARYPADSPCLMHAPHSDALRLRIPNLHACLCLCRTLARKICSRVWLDIESNTSPGCSYSSDKAANCKWLQSLVAAVKAAGVSVGIYTSIHEYELLVSDTAEDCALGAADVPLWYRE